LAVRKCGEAAVVPPGAGEGGEAVQRELDETGMQWRAHGEWEEEDDTPITRSG
jgi:hypothetical protein